MFPRFRITQILKFEGGETVLGTVTGTNYGRDGAWVQDGWLAYLMASGTFVKGRWERRGDVWAFIVKDQAAITTLPFGSEWSILHVYWGRKAELVLDTRRTWRCKQFESSDAVLWS